MPDEAIVGGLLRLIGSILAEVCGFFLEYIFERVGRIVIYILTLGRVDTDLSSTKGTTNWLSAVVGFLMIGGLFWLGWRIFSTPSPLMIGSSLSGSFLNGFWN